MHLFVLYFLFLVQEVTELICHQPSVCTQSDIHDEQYRTEQDIGTFDIGLKRAESLCPISD
jgi:hypothetical protein